MKQTPAATPAVIVPQSTSAIGKLHSAQLNPPIGCNANKYVNALITLVLTRLKSTSETSDTLMDNDEESVYPSRALVHTEEVRPRPLMQ
jgi:hypothetical protein